MDSGQNFALHSEDWTRRLILWVGRRSRHLFNRLISSSSLLGDPSVFDPRSLPWTHMIEDHWRQIRRELDAVLAYREYLPAVQEISPDHSRIARERQWTSFFLYGYGTRSAANCERCPVTARLVGQIPGLQSAFFSILNPGAHLPRHRGVTKAMLTYHLGLKVPNDPACWIRVEDQEYRWGEGHSFLFDDTRPHEVRNDSKDERVVLLIQVNRPLRPPGAWFADFFLGAVKKSPFIRDAVANQRAWEAGFVRQLNDWRDTRRSA